MPALPMSATQLLSVKLAEYVVSHTPLRLDLRSVCVTASRTSRFCERDWLAGGNMACNGCGAEEPNGLVQVERPSL